MNRRVIFLLLGIILIPESILANCFPELIAKYHLGKYDPQEFLEERGFRVIEKYPCYIITKESGQAISVHVASGDFRTHVPDSVRSIILKLFHEKIHITIYLYPKRLTAKSLGDRTLLDRMIQLEAESKSRMKRYAESIVPAEYFDFRSAIPDENNANHSPTYHFTSNGKTLDVIFAKEPGEK